LRSIKYQYFLGYAVFGSVGPYAPVYLQWRGLSDGQIGWVMSLGGISALLMPALMSLLADLKLENRVLLRSSFIGSIVSLGLLLSASQFWWLLPTFLFWRLAIAPMMPLTDGLLFGVRGLREAAGQPTPPYHRIRVFGTLGYIAPSLVLYFVMSGSDNDPSVIRYALGCGIGAAVLAGLCTLLVPRTRSAVGEPTPSPEVPDPHPPTKPGKPLPTVLAFKAMLKPDLLLFCIAMWLIQIVNTTFYVFYPLYLSRTIGVGEQWLGVISSAGVVPEIGYVLAFGWLLRKLGVRWLLIVGMAAIVVRMGLLWLTPTLGVAVGTQLLHGLIVLVIFILPPVYLNHRAEPAFRNSIQGLYAMLVFGSGGIVGSILSGQISQAYDGDVLKPFAVTAVIAAVATLLILLFFKDRSEGVIEP